MALHRRHTIQPNSPPPTRSVKDFQRSKRNVKEGRHLENDEYYKEIKDVLNKSLPKPCDFSAAESESVPLLSASDSESSEDSFCLIEKTDSSETSETLSTPLSQLSMKATRFTFPSVSGADELDVYPLKPKFFMEKIKMGRWIAQINRQMKMQSFLCNSEEGRLRSRLPVPYSKNKPSRGGTIHGVPTEDLMGRLMGLQRSLKRQNEKSRTSFFVVFDLAQIIRKFDTATLLNTVVQEQVEQILCDWIGGSSFTVENFSKLNVRLREYLEGQVKRVTREVVRDCDCELFDVDGSLVRDNSDWASLINLWRSTYFFTEARLAMVNDGNIIEGLYFDVLKEVLTSAVNKNAENIPKMVDLGHECLGELEFFMKSFAIPFSGPYRRDVAGKKTVIVYFISSMNAEDKIINGGLPLYGAFDYGTYGIEREGRPDRDGYNESHNSKRYLQNTPPIPDWLIHLPPLFYKSFDEFKEHFKAI